MSDRARRGWDQTATRSGCTFSALVEAIGLALEDGTADVPDKVAELARQIDRERFSRR